MTSNAKNPPQSQHSNAAPEIELSPSVEEVRRGLASQRAVDAWDIVQKLLRVHPEYGRGRAAKLLGARGPARGHKRPPAEWFDAVRALRWPLLEEYYLEQVNGWTEEPSAEVKALLESQAARAVLNGGAVGAMLDLQAVATLAGLRPSDAAAGAVA